MVNRHPKHEIQDTAGTVRLSDSQGGYPDLVDADRRLAILINEMVSVAAEDEPALLDRLTRLAATAESAIFHTLYRICTGRACREILECQLAEPREVRLVDLPTLRSFVEPACCRQ